MRLRLPLRASARLVATLVFVLAPVGGCKKESSDAAGVGAPARSSSSASSSATAAAPAVSAGAAAAASDADAFEGEIQMSMTNARRPAPEVLTFETKGDKTRMDLPAEHSPSGGAGYLIFDSTQKKAFVVIDDKKMIMSLDVSKVQGPPGQPQPGAGVAAKITKTGRQETVAGYPCEDWDIEKNGKKTSACMAKGIPFFMLNMQARGAGPGWFDDLQDKKTFPLRVVEHDALGAEVSRFEAKKIERRAIADARFALPVGYASMDMTSMMAGLGIPGLGAAGARGMPPGLPPSFKMPSGMKMPPGGPGQHPQMPAGTPH